MADVENPQFLGVKSYFSPTSSTAVPVSTTMNTTGLGLMHQSQPYPIIHSIHQQHHHPIHNYQPQLHQNHLYYHGNANSNNNNNNNNNNSILNYHDSSCLSSPTTIPSPPCLSSSLSSSQSSSLKQQLPQSSQFLNHFLNSNSSSSSGYYINNGTNSAISTTSGNGTMKKRSINCVDSISDNSDNALPANKKIFIEQPSKCSNNNNIIDLKQQISTPSTHCKISNFNNSFSQDDQNTIVVSSNPSSPYVFSKLKLSIEDSFCTTDQISDRQSPVTINRNLNITTNNIKKQQHISQLQNQQIINNNNNNNNNINYGPYIINQNIKTKKQSPVVSPNKKISTPVVALSNNSLSSTLSTVNQKHLNVPISNNPFIIITDKNNNFKPITKEFLPNSYSTAFPSIHYSSDQNQTYTPTRSHYSLSPFLPIEKEQLPLPIVQPSPPHNHQIQQQPTVAFKNSHVVVPLSPEINSMNKQQSIIPKVSIQSQPSTILNNTQNNSNGQNNNNKKKKTTQGYCECCNTDFESLKSHLESKEHRSFSEKDKNYAKIDAILPKLLFNSNSIW